MSLINQSNTPINDDLTYLLHTYKTLSTSKNLYGDNKQSKPIKIMFNSTIITQFITLFFSSLLSAQQALTDCQRLHSAVEINSYSQTWQTIAYTLARANCEDEEGNTAIHKFARYGKDARLLAILIYRGFGTLDQENYAGETPVMIAHKYGNTMSLMSLKGFSSATNPVV